MREFLLETAKALGVMGFFAAMAWGLRLLGI